jgi:tetratricopeptide (TPR) repeat protein
MTDPVDVEALLLRYNKVAMDYLSSDSFNECKEFLKRAIDLLKSADPTVHALPNRLKLLGLTYNNLACYFKRLRHPNVALGYLKRALEAEAQLELEVTNLAGTHLNICAIYSELGRHHESLQSAQKALGMLQQVNLQETTPGVSTLATAAIAYHNVGAELEHVCRLDEAVEVYSKGLAFAQKYLGHNYFLTESLASSYNAAVRKSKSIGEMRTLQRDRRRNLQRDSSMARQRYLPLISKSWATQRGREESRDLSNLRTKNSSTLSNCTTQLANAAKRVLGNRSVGHRRLESSVLRVI